MYELIKVSDNTYYIQSPAKIGLIKIDNNNIILIDSGNDRNAGRKIKKILDTNGWTLKAIFNTHSHADHTGGNHYLQNQTNCDIFAPGMENDFVNHPILEPLNLYGGFPFNDLKHKFLMAKESQSRELKEDFLPEGFEIIDLPGHSFEMVGFRTPDDIVFLADALSSKETLDKYKINYTYNIEDYLQTLERLKTLKAKLFIPSHAEPTENITELVDYNISRVYETKNKILEICKTPYTIEEIITKLFDEYDLTMNYEQYVLIGSTVRSYLSWLKDSGELKTFFDQNRLLWETSNLV